MSRIRYYYGDEETVLYSIYVCVNCDSELLPHEIHKGDICPFCNHVNRISTDQVEVNRGLVSRKRIAPDTFKYERVD